MKRRGGLFERIVAFENLWLAARRAQRGKRFRPETAAFNFELETMLLGLQRALAEECWRPGEYRSFWVYEPKARLISAAPYRDRVVHHAVCQVIEPIFERSFIRDSYANRLGYGTLRALKRFTAFARASRYVLQCDIRQYFPSIDHEILKGLLRRKLKCAPTLRLLERIIDGSNEQGGEAAYFPGDDLFTPYERRRGLPIGNLTSQFFANVYLNGFDHFVKERLRWRRYVRYVDDFALFGDDRGALAAAREAIEAYLATLRLRIHPVKSQLFETRLGANFVGFRVLPDRIRARSSALARMRRRWKRLQAWYRRGWVEQETVLAALRSWNAHLGHGDTWRLRTRVFERLTFQRASAD